MIWWKRGRDLLDNRLLIWFVEIFFFHWRNCLILMNIFVAMFFNDRNMLEVLVLYLRRRLSVYLTWLWMCLKRECWIIETDRVDFSGFKAGIEFGLELIASNCTEINLSHISIVLIRTRLCHLLASLEWGVDKLKDGYFTGLISFILLHWVMVRLLRGLGHESLQKDYNEYKSAQIKESKSRKVHFYMFGLLIDWMIGKSYKW